MLLNFQPFLANIMHDQLVTELGEDHRVFRANNDSGFNFHVDEGRRFDPYFFLFSYQNN